MNVYKLDREKDENGFYIYKSTLSRYDTSEIKHQMEHNGWLDNRQLIGDAWVPIDIEICEDDYDYDKLPNSDHPNTELFDVRALVLSQRAFDVLSDLLEGNGELLPLISETGTYYVFNITCEADVLDYENSEFIPKDPFYKKPNITPSCAYDIVKFAFYHEKIETLNIFKIPRIGHSYSGFFVTERFIQRVREATLKDFRFILPGAGY